MTRDTFRPPPVLPAQLPMNINSTSMVCEYCGQSVKSAVAKPVVEMMDAT